MLICLLIICWRCDATCALVGSRSDGGTTVIRRDDVDSVHDHMHKIGMKVDTGRSHVSVQSSDSSAAIAVIGENE